MGSKPDGWADDWNADCQVVWNVEDENNSNNTYAVIDGVRYALRDGEATVCAQAATIKSANIASIIKHKGREYKVTAIENDAFRNCYSLTSITIEPGITTIGEYAFSNCDELTEIVIPEGVVSIGKFAFYLCSKLEKVSIPDSIEYIADSAFEYTNKIKYNEDSGVGYLGNAKNPYIYLCSKKSSALSTLNVRNTCKVIKGGVFSSCYSLTKVNIPASVTYIGDVAFAYSPSIISITVDENNLNYCSVDGNLYSKDKTRLIQYAAGKSELNFVVLSGVKYIETGAFAVCKNLTRVILPDTVISIGKKAFYDSDKLSGVIMEEGLTHIGEEAFYSCVSLMNIDLPSSLTHIGACAFENSYNLEKVVISKSVTYIGMFAFDSCSRVFIYCEAESKPEGWSDDWNANCGHVFWYRETKPNAGLYWHYVDGKVVTWSSFS